MLWLNLLAIGCGAVAGAWIRWGLGMLLNPVHPTLPLGTLTANLLGGLIIGVVMTLAEPLDFSPSLRLLITTGFLGALTTFSTFSAETVTLLSRAQYGWAAGTIALHVSGSLLMTGTGVFLARIALDAYHGPS